MVSSLSSQSESSSCSVSAAVDGPLEQRSTNITNATTTTTTSSSTTPTSSSCMNRRMRRPHQHYSNVKHVQPVFQLPLIFVVLLQLLFFCGTHADKDSNVYPWGTNPNSHFKMYWKDAANVIQDLTQFQALYITVHGCVWSECGVDNFDDDGENHDGDEEWYQSRTRTFCANAAYSLYGIRKNNFKLINTCSKGTYINSFFTYGGADTLAQALDLTISTKDNNRYTNTNNYNDDSYPFTSNSDCVAIDQYGNRFLEEEDDVDDAVASGSSTSWSSSVVSATMGCAANPTSKYNTFALAGFSDDYCSGQTFVETLDSYKSYNKAMHKVTCHRIWDLASYNRNKNTDDAYNNNDDAAAADDGNRRALLRQTNNHQDSSNMDPQQDEVELVVDYTHEEDHEHNDHRQLSNDNNINYNKRNYKSVAEQLFYHSWACDLTLYPTQCPDPYGLKRKYTNVLKAAANGQPVALAIMNARLRKPIRILTYLCAATGIYLLFFAYYLKNKAYIQNHGGGVVGVWATIQRDIFAAHVVLTEKVKRARERHLQNKRNRKAAVAEANANGGGGGGGGHRRSSSNGGGGGGMWNALFGKVKNKKKMKKRRSKHHHASVKRTPSGRSIREAYSGDEDDVSDGDEYEEMTDEYQSQRSRQSSRYTSAHHSSSRTSRAAEAAFAAAAQFDLEQQGGGGGGGSNTSSSRRLGHPAILPAHPNSRRSRSRTRTSSSRRLSTRSSSNNRGGGGGGGSSRSLSHSSSRRSRSNPSGSNRRLDQSRTRSPGGTSVRRPSSQTRRPSSTQRRKSPDGRGFV